ncbi:chorismate mutase [Cognatishimia sp. 1_MG-2023]|uniref:chorismate mutase n=1 Tax=Cognatishimia sp. 1_MG-2023 TaxID=3062642 RepID=UPI0026E3A9B8|nr:chorismate mutase [Cognatishimia sp. 1_MG-2023]MDO6726571.1 chorismate mutase [Cognatishimia sp. 1_MG-2023]
MSAPLSPRDCSDMTDVRAGIDALDKTLVALLVERAGYITRAMELKQVNGWPARIPARVEEVVQNVRREAETQGLDPELVDQLWRQLIDWSIDLEEEGLSRDKA